MVVLKFWRKIRSYIKQLLCCHDYQEKCRLGKYFDFCSHRKDYGICVGWSDDGEFTWDCDHLYLKCSKCGKEIG